MLSQQQVLQEVKGGRTSAIEMIDSRDYARLCEFFPVEHWPVFGFTLKEGLDPGAVKPPRPWTEEEVLSQLREDVAFGFEKALSQRGISASLMNAVVKMWLWILEVPDFAHLGYAQYGLPLLKAVALKFGFPNEIGEDAGDEWRYSAEGG